MTLIKRIKFSLAGIIGAWVVRGLNLTQRYKEINSEYYLRFHREGKGVIYAFWHGRMLIPAYTFRKRKIHILISLHEDGEYIAQIVKRLGFGIVRGSTTRGGTDAIRKLRRAADEGYDLAFTPDGPRGPRYIVQKGLIHLAQLTGLPILPAGIEPSKYWQLRSWDEFRIPKPFGKTMVHLGEPIFVPKEAVGKELDTIRDEVEAEINRLTLLVEEELKK